ncbi:MAG TPA: hypothetical protein VFJ43_09060, partial [Bacteroidia bacterium]|nr:hypothetical protein [Bacteroidia bacterium]
KIHIKTTTNCFRRKLEMETKMKLHQRIQDQVENLANRKKGKKYSRNQKINQNQNRTIEGLASSEMIHINEAIKNILTGYTPRKEIWKK